MLTRWVGLLIMTQKLNLPTKEFPNSCLSEARTADISVQVSSLTHMSYSLRQLQSLVIIPLTGS